MDTQSTGILKQLLERLDKMDSQQHKLDRVVERLDTLQNIIERQNQKQNLLDEKLVEMTIKRQQEKTVLREQLQEALQEILEPFRAIDSQGEPTPSPLRTIQPIQSFITQIGYTLKSIEEKTIDTAQQCNQLTSLSRKMEEKITDNAGNSTDMMKTFLVESRSVKDLIKAQTNSELIWLNNQLDKKLSDIGSVVRDIYQQQTEAQEETVRSTGQLVKTDMQHGKQQGNTSEPLCDKPKLSAGICNKQMQAMQDLETKVEKFNLSVLEVAMEIKTNLETTLATNTLSIIDLENKNFEAVLSELETNRKRGITESETHTIRIISAVETAKEDLRKLIKAEGDNSSMCKVELGNIHMLIDSILVNIQGNTTIVGEKIDSTKSSMLSRHGILKKKLEELATHTAVNTNLEELTSDLKDYIYKTKREIFAVTEKESQIVRDRIQGPLPSLGKYTFDFYVNNFNTLVRSGKEVYSLPWHINELQTCVTGNVTMSTNGEMKVWLLEGRHVREVGLQPRSGKTLKVKATICDIKENILPSLVVGEEDFEVDEAETNFNGDWGCQMGVMSCDMLLESGYGYEEGYNENALLIRYEVTVL